MKNFFLTALVACYLCGCATTWQGAAGKSLITIAQTADSAMKGWEAYSVRMGIADNNIREINVQIAYKKYQVAFNTALQAYNAAVISKDKTGWEQASAALVASQSGLVQLITQEEK